MATLPYKALAIVTLTLGECERRINPTSRFPSNQMQFTMPLLTDATIISGPLARTPRRLRALQSARGLVPGRVGDIVATGRVRRLFWRVADELHYLWTLATLRILDALAGPLSETPADRQRTRDRERLEKAFPAIEPKGGDVMAVDEDRKRPWRGSQRT